MDLGMRTILSLGYMPYMIAVSLEMSDEPKLGGQRFGDKKKKRTFAAQFSQLSKTEE